MIRRLVPFVVLAAVVAGAFFGFQAYQRHLAELPIEWSGTVEARTIEVGSRVGGRVKEISVREGDHVKAGQTLITLEPGDLEAQKLQAEGQLEQMQANLEKLSNHSSGARYQEIAAARARLQADEIAVEKATLDLNRTKKLLAGGASTQTDMDNAEIGLRNAVAQRDALQATLDQLTHGTPQDVKAAEGQVEAAKGKLAQIETMLAELEIRSPRNAEVETLDLRPGDILAPDAVASKLLEPDQLFVRIYVPETQLGRVKVAQEIPLYIDTYPDQVYRGVVESISPEGEFTPRNLQTADERADQVFATRIRLLTGQDVLRAGMAAFARLPRVAP